MCSSRSHWSHSPLDSQKIYRITEYDDRLLVIIIYSCFSNHQIHCCRYRQAKINLRDPKFPFFPGTLLLVNHQIFLQFKRYSTPIHFSSMHAMVHHTNSSPQWLLVVGELFLKTTPRRTSVFLFSMFYAKSLLWEEDPCGCGREGRAQAALHFGFDVRSISLPLS